MHTLQAIPSFFAVPKKALWLMTALICGVVLSLTAATSNALDLVAFAGIAGPLTAALTQLASLAPGVKALIGFIGFVVALVSLAGSTEVFQPTPPQRRLMQSRPLIQTATVERPETFILCRLSGKVPAPRLGASQQPNHRTHRGGV